MKLFGLSDRLALFMQLIELVMLAERLRNSSSLHEVMRRSLHIVLPADLRDLGETLLSKVQKMDKARISRSHLTLDVGFMMHRRVRNSLKPEQIRYLMWDSSPQFGRDYQMCLVQEVEAQDLAHMFLKVQCLVQAWQPQDGVEPAFDDEQAIEHEAQQMQELRAKLQVHALPTVLIGFGAASFAHKLWALLHSARLECFNSEALAQWTRSVLSVASDYGVERMLADTQHVNAAEVIGWFEDTSAEDVGLLVSGPEVVPNAVERPVAANMQADVLEDTAAAMQVVDRQLADQVRKFEGWISPGRWGTIAFSVPEVLKIKIAMVTCWDERLFLQGLDAAEDQRNRSARELAVDVSKAVHDPAWWGWMAMLEVVCSLLRQHTIWAESCPCHHDLLRTRRHDVTAALRQQWESCPMRGMRAAELSSGEFLDLIGTLWRVSAVQMLQVLPANISQEDRRVIVQEFDRARTHLSLYFTLKLSHLQEMPHLILQVSHCNDVTAQQALPRVLSSRNSHPLVQKLQGPLRRACDRWLDGAPLTDPRQAPLVNLAASLRFIPTSERPIEGQRAKIHRQGLGRPNHTEHFQSYYVRSGEMARALETGGLSLQNFAWYCQAARNQYKACVAVGLSGHPAINPNSLRRRRDRNSLMSQVIYHADPFTLYTASPPDVHMKPRGGGGRGALPALPDQREDALPDGEASGSGRVSACSLL